jgi:hypothetical protein
MVKWLLYNDQMSAIDAAQKRYYKNHPAGEDDAAIWVQKFLREIGKMDGHAKTTGEAANTSSSPF